MSRRFAFDSPDLVRPTSFGFQAAFVCFLLTALFCTLVDLESIRPSWTEEPDWTNGYTPPLPPSMQDDVTLHSSTCRREFPLLYAQLEENEVSWRAKGGLTLHHVDEAWERCANGCARVIIQDGQVFLRGYAKDWQSRLASMLGLLQTAIESASWEEKQQLNNIDFVLNGADKPEHGGEGGDGAAWVLCKKVNAPPGQYLAPDFSFGAWPEAGIASYREFRRDARNVNKQLPWDRKEDKAIWRGAMLKHIGVPIRDNLWEVTHQPGFMDLFDVKETNFWDQGPQFAPIEPPVYFCKNKYLLHTEGNAYSGRSKFLLGCGSAVIIHRLDWTQHFHPALITAPAHPDHNVIQSPGEMWHGLPALMEQLRTSDEGERVAEAANRTLTNRYLTPASISCYLRAALMSYGSIMARSTWPNGEGAQVIEGGGVKPGAGARATVTLKDLGVQGDIEYNVWLNLGQPQWPPT